MAHPLVRTGRRYIIAGALMSVAMGALSLYAGVGLAPAALACFVGAFLIWNGRALVTSGTAIPLLQQSVALITKGKLDEAERVTTTLPPNVARAPMIARAITTQRALIALMRGDAAAAEAHATESTAIPSSAFAGDWHEVYRMEARATRALARAAQGNAQGAIEDAGTIESSKHALSTSLARASLARAIVHARSGDKVALGEHLTTQGSLILEQVMPRERSLTRALRAMARAPGKSVYREAARPTDDSEEGRVRDWIGKVAPDAAGFAPREAQVVAVEQPAPQADAEAMGRIAGARAAAAAKTKRRSVLVILGLWGVLVAMFLALFALMNVTADQRVATSAEPEVTTSSASSLPVAAVVGGFFIAFFALWIYRHRLQQRRIFAADRDIALGRVDAARNDLLKLARGPFPALAATARLRLAMLANKEGRFLDAVNEADVGLGLCNRGATVKALTTDLVAPGLLAERAFALAALDRFAEAETELAHLAHGFPAFALLERATFRVRLITSVRRKDVATAARIARSRTPELPLDLKTDLLADVALAASGEPMSSDERERIAVELRAMPDVNAWIEKVAGDLSTLSTGPDADEEEAEDDLDQPQIAQA